MTTSVEKLESIVKKPSVTGTTFLGCGTQRIILNSGWSVQPKNQANILVSGNKYIPLSNLNCHSEQSESKDTTGNNPSDSIDINRNLSDSAVELIPGLSDKESDTAVRDLSVSVSSLSQMCDMEVELGCGEKMSTSLSNGSKNLADQSNGSPQIEEDESASQTSDDIVLSENSNSEDTSIQEKVETHKTAARLQLNAALQSEIENRRAIKALKTHKLTNTGRPFDLKSQDLSTKLSNLTAVSLSSISKKSLGQNIFGTKSNLSQVVRIQNAKIVEVFEREDKVPWPEVRMPKQMLSCDEFVSLNGHLKENRVIIGRLQVADDIYGRTRSPELIVVPTQDSTKFDEVTVEVKSEPSLIHSHDLDQHGHGEECQTFIYDPLCVSADTLVPVAGNPGHSERQEMDEIDMMCLQQENNRVSGKELLPNRSNAPVLRCFLCPYYHTKQTKIAKHWINTHLVQRPYVCPHCDLDFATSWSVQVHIVKSHPGQSLTVSIKNSTHFATSLAYEVVQSDAMDSQTVPDVEAEVIADEAINSNSVAFSCKKCDYRCDSAQDLKSHLKTIHLRYKPHFCIYCTPQKHSFVCDFDLKQHIRLHHPERVLPAGRSGLQDAGVTMMTADINWSSTYEAISISNKVLYQCRFCTFRSPLSEVTWKHVLIIHEWPKEVKCPSCANSFELADNNRQNFLAVCTHCQVQMALGPDSIAGRPQDKGDPVYICTICDYKTMGKGSMNRHLKYNHTKCRPYGCGYCNYVAVERPKVKMHIESLHKGKPLAIKERSESNEMFRKVVEELFSTIVRMEYFHGVQNSMDTAVGDRLNNNKFSGTWTHEVDAESNENELRQPRKRSRLNLADSDVNYVLDPSLGIVLDSDLGPSPREREKKVITGEHFKCAVCGYVCVDRSCMSRHVKYMHIPSRPHSCPYCWYNNVEKTKVRLHVKTHHPNHPKCVKTDRKLLEQMSYEAKRFYVRVDSKGRIMKENGSISAIPQIPITLEADHNTESQESSSAAVMDEFVLTELDPETDILDVQTEHGAATVVLKNGVYQVGIKEEPLDDVEIKQEPGIQVIRPVDQATITSALDHNYVIDLPHSAPIAMDLPVTVKTEPADTGYENSLENPPVESCGFGQKASSAEITNLESSDGEDNEEGEITVNVPLGASAANMDGLPGLESDDDLESGSDSDLLDVADIDLGDLEYPFMEIASSQQKTAEAQAEQDRLQLLNQLQMDDAVRDDPKIWMWPVVKLEAIVPLMCSYEPLMDLLLDDI